MTIERVRAVIDAANGEGRQDDIMLALDVESGLMPELLALWEAAKYQHETGSLHEHDHEPPYEWCCGTGAALAVLDAKAEEVLG